MDGQTNSGLDELSRLLNKINEQGGFSMSILTDRQGFSIASTATDEHKPDIKAATVAVVNKMLTQAREQLDMSPTDEIVLRSTDGQRLICRPFSVQGHDLILAVLVPGREKPYRKLMNQTLRDIEHIWTRYWG